MMLADCSLGYVAVPLSSSYTIVATGSLLNMPSSCYSDSFYGSSGSFGFQWTDTNSLQSPTTVVIDINFGVTCESGYTRSVTLNNSPPKQVAATSYCYCGPGRYPVTLTFDGAYYNTVRAVSVTKRYCRT